MVAVCSSQTSYSVKGVPFGTLLHPVSRRRNGMACSTYVWTYEEVWRVIFTRCGLPITLILDYLWYGVSSTAGAYLPVHMSTAWAVKVGTFG